VPKLYIFYFSHSIKNIILTGDQLLAGSFVLLSPYVLHHDSRWWSSPEDFDPQRFSEENEKKIEKNVYLPFGGGPRICIGNHFALMEAQILLAMIVRRFSLRLVPGARVEPLRQVTCSPKYGLPMIVEPRD
jgi:cytochrome P450